MQPLTVDGLEQPLQSAVGVPAPTVQGINGQQACTLQSAAAVLGSTQATEQQAGQACLECLLNDVG